MAAIASSSTATAGPAATSTDPTNAAKPVKMSTDSTLPPRTLVLCFDGTSNQYDGDNTNVVKLYALLKKDVTDEQLCYYQPGIGTYIQPGVVSPLFQWCAKIADEAVAWYLDAHVRGGYQFLMQNYRPRDKICIFGFSRGAYTARALAGFIHKIGLLPKDNPEQVPLAYKLFKRTDATSIQLAAGFKETFCRDVKIEFVGVWDTVASVGVLMSKTLPFTTSNTTIKTFRHALSLDEHRAKFRPNLYHRPVPEKASAPKTAPKQPASPIVASPTSMKSPASMTTSESTQPLQSSSAHNRQIRPRGRAAKFQPFPQVHAKKSLNKMFRGRNKALPKQRELTAFNDPSERSDDSVGETDVLEVWFAGCHSDVGGGATQNATTHCLSDITLRWMVREVASAQCGILFDSDALARAGIPDEIFPCNGFRTKGGLLAQLVIPKEKEAARERETAKEKEQEAHKGRETHESEKDVSASDSEAGASDVADDDALQPLHDELVLDPWWWLLEIVPTDYEWQDGNGTWHRKWGFHCGKGRKIPSDIKPLFHETVKQRMEYAPLKYTPRATWKKGTETYVS